MPHPVDLKVVFTPRNFSFVDFGETQAPQGDCFQSNIISAYCPHLNFGDRSFHGLPKKLS